MNEPIPVEVRFWDKVDRSGGPEACWIWTASRTGGGYGQIGITSSPGVSRPHLAHRVSYEMAKGPIPDGLQVDHLCSVPLCVNPLHLEAVTPRVNTLRSTALSAQNARKTHCPEGHPLSGANLWVERTARGGLGRHCRECKRQRDRKYAEQRRSA